MIHKLLLLIFVLFSLVPLDASANIDAKRETVNIFTWWGYFNNPDLVKMTEKQCNVDLSIDQYYTNKEFLRRYQKNKNMYDVIIFSNLNYYLVSDDLPVIKSSPLNNRVSMYTPVVRTHYLKMKYPSNIAYFALSITGFLYNPRNISIDDIDSLSEIFKKAGSKTVIIMDDAIEFNQLLRLERHSKMNSSYNYLDLLNLKSGLNQNSQVYIGNGIRQMYEGDDLAFAISWSGEAMKRIQTTHVNYEFYIHPRLSFVSTDLIAQTSKSKSAECVAYYLSGKQALSLMERNNYYFSPYGPNRANLDPRVVRIYDEYVRLLPKLSWIAPLNQVEFDEINKSWDITKLNLNTKD